MANLTEARVYVGTYGKYNNGSIAGEWLDLSDYSSKEEFYEACAALHSDEADPEFMFQDHENIPGDLIGESHISDNIFEIIAAVSEMDEERQEAFFIWANNRSADLENNGIHDLIQSFDDDYCGYYNGYNPQQDYAYDVAEELIPSDAPSFLKTYFDYEAFARDLFIGDNWEESGHVFRNS